MSEEGWTDEQYIQILRNHAEEQRREIEALRTRATLAETQASAYRAQGRAEGFAAARNKAALLAQEVGDEYAGDDDMDAARGADAVSHRIREMKDA